MANESGDIVNIVFVGVGAMGSGMALHLASQSYSVLAFDEHEPTLQKFKEAYPRSNDILVSKQSSIRTAVDLVNPFPGPKSSPDVVVMMVVNSEQIEEFLFGDIGANTSYVSTLPRVTQLPNLEVLLYLT
jgi:3-hydroxyisobutyrate dehydrogenase-like beta-hydroxyacid dehydrogenase